MCLSSLTPEFAEDLQSRYWVHLNSDTAYEGEGWDDDYDDGEDDEEQEDEQPDGEAHATADP